MASSPKWGELPRIIKGDLDVFTIERYPDFVSMIFVSNQTDCIKMYCCRSGVRNSFEETILLARHEFDNGWAKRLTSMRIRLVLDKMYGPKFAAMDGDKEYDEILAAQELMEATDGQERQG